MVFSSCHLYYICYFVALKGNGTVWTWGYNANGELGVGDNTNKTKPTQAIAEVEQSDGSKVDQKIEDAIDIAAGANHTLILRKDGTVRAKEGVVGEKGRKLGRNREKIVEGAREKI